MIRIKIGLGVLICCVTILLSIQASAQSLVQIKVEDPIRLDKDTVQVRFTIAIDSGWSIYTQSPINKAQQVEMAVLSVSLNGITQSVHAEDPEAVFEKGYEVYANGENHFVRRFLLPRKKSSAKEMSLYIEFQFQACNDRMCLPVQTVKVIRNFSVK